MKSLFAFLLLVGSTLAYSQEAMYSICPIKNSEKVPSTEVYATNGDTVDLKTYIGDRPVILVFYRGGWCPYCMRHLSALGQIKDSIDDRGFELIGITPDDFTNLDSSVVRGDDSQYKLFSDNQAAAMDAFGIGWKVGDKLFDKYKNGYGVDLEWWSSNKHHKLPVPSVFFIKNGEIQFQHVDPNYSKRLSPELLLAILDNLK